MTINFPINPTLDQLYSFDTKTWQWTGTYWIVYSAQTGYITYAITGASYSSNLGVLELFDSVGATISLTGFTENELKYYVQETSPIATLKNGDRWFNTLTGVELVWVDDGDSGQWIQPVASYAPADFDTLNGGNY